MLWGAVAVLVVMTTSACAPGGASRPVPAATSADAAPAPSAAPTVTFTAVVDGDTIETSAGTVRIIGIDAPERGVCGYDEASALVSSLLGAGDPITLQLPAGENDTDKYGRILRYVDTAGGEDVAAALLSAGLAVARYDSTDGYPAHPREASYHAAQAATLTADGAVTTVACKAAADAAAAQAQQEQQAQQQAPAPLAAPAAPPTDQWWKKYSSCGKLKKNTVGDPTGPFARDDPAQAAIYDWFENGTGNNGDGDDDGYACE